MNKDLRLKNEKEYFKSINHYSLIINRKSGGFTLIELLVLIVVLSAVGSIVIGIITFSIRGTNKTNTIENIRQSGNYAISQMSKTIEYAQSFEGLSTDGIIYDKVCPVGAVPPTTTSYNRIKITPFNNPPIEYACNDLGGGNIFSLTSNGTSLIDTVTAGAEIKMTSCSFKCTVSNAVDVPIISVSFSIEPATTSTLVEKVATPITFETSVTMRNYQK